jgi:hypothetical protein
MRRRLRVDWIIVLTLAGNLLVFGLMVIGALQVLRWLGV